MVNSSQQKAPTETEFIDLLKKHSLKATPQRTAVHRAMLKLGHASADMVADEIALEGRTKVTVASVYNILTQMALLGIYKHRLSSNSKMYFDVNTFSHLHLYDTRNNTYKDILDEELLEIVKAHVAKRRFRGYSVDGIDIQILCHPTKNKSRLSM